MTATLLIEQFTAELQASHGTIERMLTDGALREVVLRVTDACMNTLSRGGKILLAGNGGSAADAQHVAAEFVSRFNYDRPGLAAVSLTTDSSILTAIGNDYGYERLFARQVEALGREDDLFWCFSTSGNSPNILAGLAAARAKGLRTVGFTGQGGGKMAQPGCCDLLVQVPAGSTPRIQEAHIMLGHMVCGFVEQLTFPRAAYATPPK